MCISSTYMIQWKDQPKRNRVPSHDSRQRLDHQIYTSPLQYYQDSVCILLVLLQQSTFRGTTAIGIMKTMSKFDVREPKREFVVSAYKYSQRYEHRLYHCNTFKGK